MVQTIKGEPGEDEFLPSWTMIDKKLVGPDTLESILLTRIRFDSKRLEWFVNGWNDTNYQYNSFTKNCQSVMDDLMLVLNLKPIQRVLPWALDYVVSFCMLVSTVPFAYNYLIRFELFNSFQTPDWTLHFVLLMFSLLAVSWLIVFLFRDTVGGTIKIKSMVIGWMYIQTYITVTYNWYHALLFFNTQWAALLMMYLWYRFFRLIIYGNCLQYPKDYSWFSNVSQNVTQNY
jgi:hypothetical protein